MRLCYILLKENIMNTLSAYDSSLPNIGISGAIHDSIAEAQASYHLARLGIVRCNNHYPAIFKDANTEPYRAVPDFVHELVPVWFEFKCTERLNGLKSLASAASALTRLQREELAGFVNSRNRQYKMLQAAWSESIKKLAGVVATMTAAQVVLIRASEPDATEHKRLLAHGIFYRTMANISGFAFFLKLASMGLDVGFYTGDHEFSVVAA